MESNQIVSASVKIAPSDKRCRYWAKIVRADVALPFPSDVNGASDVPGAYIKPGEEEIFAGDVLIEGEENHHRNNRGWSYWITWINADGKTMRMRDPGAGVKAAMKAASCNKALLPGSGMIAACVRTAHGIRIGMIDGAMFAATVLE